MFLRLIRAGLLAWIWLSNTTAWAEQAPAADEVTTVRAVDWRNRSYEISPCPEALCTPGAGPSSTRVAVRQGRFQRGSLTRSYYSLEILTVVYGDLRGTGAEEAVVVGRQNFGGNADSYSIWIFGLEDGRPRLVATLPPPDPSQLWEQLRHVSIEGERLILRRAWWTSRDPHAAPSRSRIETWRWDGRAFVEVVAARTYWIYPWERHRARPVAAAPR